MIRFASAAFLMGVFCGTGYAGDFADVALSDESTPLLGGRLQARLPVGAKVEARAVNIMAAKESPEEETRVVFDLGEKRLVVMLYETFSTAGPDFAAVLKKMNREARQDRRTARTRLVLRQDNLEVYQAKVSLVNTDREAILIASAWIVNTDQTVQLLAAYANRMAGAEPRDVRKLCSRILKTLEPGEKGIVTKARKQRLHVYSKTKELVVDLPDGWVHTLQPGPDFLVHRLRQLGPFPAERPSIGVYVGNHPSYHYKREETEPEQSQGPLIGKQVDWFKAVRGEGVRIEAIRPAEDLDEHEHLMLHVFLSAASNKDLQAARAIVESIRIMENDE